MTKFGLVFLMLLLGTAAFGFLRTLSPEPAPPAVAANRRLTALTGLPLYVLLLGIAVTIVFIQPLLSEHYLIGFLLIPPLMLKLASSGYRFMRYYLRDPGYRLAGAPPLLLRLVIAPALVVSTVAVFATGLELWAFGLRLGSGWASIHTLSAVVFVVAAGAHLLGHSRQSVASAISRDAITARSLVVGSLVLGSALAAASLSYASPFPLLAAGR